MHMLRKSGSRKSEDNVDVGAALKRWSGQTNGMNEFEVRYAQKEYDKMSNMYEELIETPLWKKRKKI